MTDKISKTLIQPQIIPPSHRNQITKPMMWQFMSNQISNPKSGFIGHLLLDNWSIIDDDNPGILHRPPFVFMCEYLVILGKRKLMPEKLLVEVHALGGDLLDEGQHPLQVAYFWLDAVDWHGDFLGYAFGTWD